ncbi:hypothetical protein VIGAN_01297200 [Vigna angularis var. angularis]|uniref:Retrotransposon gag domain-containing protein n=1 Tax=Vigna angularis var. angularis TaxID=157739 RepID=A0A0S3R3B6_PHAAN|nr:hypothetical protein VIGAN_01297200 [Vigna angularis var. angularis]
MVNNLHSFSIAKDMWNYLKRVFNQDHSAKRFQLELDIANYSQANFSVQEYYFGFLNLWVEHSAILHAVVPGTSLVVVQEVYEVIKQDQFHMKLRPKFEAVCAALLNQNPLHSLEVCVGEHLWEERLLTQAALSCDSSVLEAIVVANTA